MSSMPARRSRALACATRWLAFVAATVGSVAAFGQTPKPAPAWKGDALVAPPTSGWPTNGGDWYNRRYSPLTQIDRSNVGKLKGVWRTRLGGSGVGTKYSGEEIGRAHV